MKVVTFSALRTGRFQLQDLFLVHISIRGWVKPRAIFIHVHMKGSARSTDLYLTTNNKHNRQINIRLYCTRDLLVAKTFNWQHTTPKTDRQQYDCPVHGISPSHWPVPENTQHSKQTDIHKTPLYKWSARRGDLQLTKNNTHNREKSTRLLCKTYQPIAQISTWKHKTLTTERHPQDYSVKGIRLSQRYLPDNTQHSQQTDMHTTLL